MEVAAWGPQSMVFGLYLKEHGRTKKGTKNWKEKKRCIYCILIWASIRPKLAGLMLFSVSSGQVLGLRPVEAASPAPPGGVVSQCTPPAPLQCPPELWSWAACPWDVTWLLFWGRWAWQQLLYSLGFSSGFQAGSLLPFSCNTLS